MRHLNDVTGINAERKSSKSLDFTRRLEQDSMKNGSHKMFEAVNTSVDFATERR